MIGKLDGRGFLLGLSLGMLLMAGILFAFQNPLDNPAERETVHTVVLKWPPREIGPKGAFSAYVASWTPDSDVAILAVYVWMGNPSSVRWEGDVYVTLNNRGDFESPDQVIVHYQFDKHSPTSLPHQEMYYLALGGGSKGFLVRKGQTIWIWANFVNVDPIGVVAGDGQVILYYASA